MDFFTSAFEAKNYNNKIKENMSVEDQFEMLSGCLISHIRAEIGNREFRVLEKIVDVFKEGEENIILENYKKRHNGEQGLFRIKKYRITDLREAYEFLNEDDKYVLFENIFNKPYLPDDFNNPEKAVEAVLKNDKKSDYYNPAIKLEIEKAIAERYYSHFYNDLALNLRLMIDYSSKNGYTFKPYVKDLAKKRNMSLEEFESKVLKIEA